VPGTPFNGIPGDILLPTYVSILSSTAANPTVIRTSSAHGLRSGDVVDITDHSVNTGANGFGLVASIVDSTHFSVPIDTSTYSNGANTGAVYPRAFTGNVTLLPANSDPYSAATYIPAAACEADRTAWQLSQTGIYRLMGGVFSLTSIASADPGFTTNWAFVNYNNGKTAAAPGPIVTSSSSGAQPAFGSLLRAGAVPVGDADIIDISVMVSLHQIGTGNGAATGSQDVFLSLFGAYYVPGFGGTKTWTQLPFSARVFRSYIAAAGTAAYPQGGSLTLRSRFQVFNLNGHAQGHGAVDTSGMLDVQMYAGQTAGSVSDYQTALYGDSLLTMDVLRATQVYPAT